MKASRCYDLARQEEYFTPGGTLQWHCKFKQGVKSNTGMDFPLRQGQLPIYCMGNKILYSNFQIRFIDAKSNI